MTNKSRTLYTGVTNNLRRRVFEHKHHLIDGFTKKYNITDPSKIRVQRYKGLGEMNPDELWETTMNPQTRRLFRIIYDDLVAADNIFSILMGNEVEPRRNFILKNFHGVKNLDI